MKDWFFAESPEEIYPCLFCGTGKPGDFCTPCQKELQNMPGAWFNFVKKYRGPAYVFTCEVIERYLRFYKITILSTKDEDFWHAHINLLLHKKSYKRKVYWRSKPSTNGCNAIKLFGRCYEYKTIWVFGKQYWGLPSDKFQVVKSMLRHIKKLDNINEEKDAWLRLQQQVI
jgi:hypothetical protein